MFCKITSASILGIEGQICNVEVDSSNGIPFFNMVGLLSSESKEAKDRVRIAIKNSGFGFDNKKITVNISPADIKKTGTAFDLPICIGLLYNMGTITRYIGNDIFIAGEISLNGAVIPLKGIISMIEAAKKHGCKYCFVPSKNYKEARLVDDMHIIGVSSLRELVEKINHKILTDFHDESYTTLAKVAPYSNTLFEEIKSQKLGVRAALIAACGNHNLMLTGENGIGKTMIAKALLGILPPLEKNEMLECTKLHSVQGLLFEDNIINCRPFRAPHQGITSTALIGGGVYPQPGEISLAHNGILYLDEFSLFRNNVLDSLRSPLENKFVIISRRSGTFIFPAKVLIIASMNCCACGAYPDLQKCTCSKADLKRYRSKISNPILDRFDLFCMLKRPKINSKLDISDTTANMKKIVIETRKLQINRNPDGLLNSELTSKNILDVCKINSNIYNNFLDIIDTLKISMRGYTRIFKVARTIADIDKSNLVKKIHLDEALIYERARGEL